MRDRYARKLIREDLGETLFVEAGAGSGKTTSLVERVVAIVLREEVPLSQVAAVTFTERAAAELRDRLRRAFTKHLPEKEAEDALSDLDGAAIGTLHAFAQRILTEHPIEAGLPPLLDVQDEVASGVTADARWLTLRTELLEDPDLTDLLMLAMAAGVKIEHLRTLTFVLNANWDLIESRVLPAPVPPLPPVDVAPLVAEGRRLAALAAHCLRDDDKMLPCLRKLSEWTEQLASAPDDPARLTVLGAAIVKGWRAGQAANWPSYPIATLRSEAVGLGDQAQRLRDAIMEATLRRITRRLGQAVLSEAAVRRTEGRLEFHDLLVLARDLLRSPRYGADVRARLQAKYRRLLLDEFQDTDPIQIELAVRIAGGAAAVQDEWPDVTVPGGSLFFVGDPKQSIYRFRRADIGMYLHAQAMLGREVVLDTNFRTTAPIVDWINSVFGQLIIYSQDSQPAYRPLSAHRTSPAPRGPAVCALGTVLHSDRPDAFALREREAADVVAAIRTALLERWQVAEGDGWRDIELRDICVLVPARTSLPQLEQALSAAGIGFHPGATSLVYRTREVRDLLTAARAADDPTDQLALVTALRSPLFGCGDDDLWTFRSAGGRMNLFSSADVPPSHPVGLALEYLRKLHNERDWLAPSAVLTRLITDRRMFEQAVGAPRTRDVWRRLRFVVDQARAWSDTAHGGLREYLAWATRQGSDTARVAEAALPETDADTLKIMTIHSAKGLEFPMVIVSGLTTRLVPPAKGLQVLWPPAGGYSLRLSSSAKTADFDAAQPIDEQMSADEKLRLLYVACTRAKDHLVVSLHRKTNGTSTSAEVLASAAGGMSPLVPVDLALDLPDPPPVSPPPSWGRWTTAMTASRASAARPAAASASGFEGVLPSVSDPGLAKAPRDLELAPWHKGRYGTAIGRAVHGVLQSVDLTPSSSAPSSSAPSSSAPSSSGPSASGPSASGPAPFWVGLDDAVAAQTLAEGVVPLAGLVRSLAVSALESPLIRRAARRPYWRESYVGTVVGDQVLEGMIDLLFRDDDGGLVVVDYKTDAVPASALSARVDFYRPQMAAYAAAVSAATGEPAPRCVLLFLSPSGAEAWEVPELPAAMTAVRAAMLA